MHEQSQHEQPKREQSKREKSQHAQPRHEEPMHAHPYRRLALMAALSFIAMYVLMYAMVDTLANVLPNLNQAYMAGLMTAPMVAIELIVMAGMYPDRRLNLALLAACLIAGLAFFAAIRAQTAIGDEQFVRSMIPHHAGAILMCEQSPLQDPELQALCQSIIAGQQAEIDLMTAKLNELQR
jgi:uncharacterized protein (DUF305 family)